MEPENTRHKLINEAQEVEGLPESNTEESKTLQLNVSLPSGRCAALSLPLEGTVLDLKLAAQQSLGQGFLTLAAPDGRLLNPTEPLQVSGLQSGDSVTAVAQQLKVAATSAAMVLWRVGGNRIVTWGSPGFGGDSTRVRDQLRNVQQIHATSLAFAAILADGSVVTWGHPRYGGDSTRVRDQLRNVQQIHATRFAFAAILADGSVVTWGSPGCGGDSTGVRVQVWDL